jgi:2,3-bisphosphoglycerate-independent phosphoglycerate mutase
MKHILFIFVDGIGLGADNPAINPFVVANLPTLTALTNGKKWIAGIGQQVSARAIFIPTDPRLGVTGRPQSGSSQAAILTGKNVPQLIGRHYGPKPDAATRQLLSEGNFFMQVQQHGKRAALLDGYPPQLLHDIERGYTLPSSIQYAALQAGQHLFTREDVLAGRALTAEYTGNAWREHLQLADTPLYTPLAAGRKLVELSRNYDFAFHSHWMTDYVGHRGPFERGVELLEILDGVIAGVLAMWHDDEGLVILTSDHGNLEHIGDRKHTENDVPTLIIGAGKEVFADGLTQLTDFVPRMAHYLFG